MFVKLTRINTREIEKEIVVNVDEIVFVTEIEDKVDYENSVEETEDSTIETTKKVVTKRYLVAFKNGLPPQIIDQDSYNELKNVLLSK